MVNIDTFLHLYYSWFAQIKATSYIGSSWLPRIRCYITVVTELMGAQASLNYLLMNIKLLELFIYISIMPKDGQWNSILKGLSVYVH